MRCHLPFVLTAEAVNGWAWNVDTDQSLSLHNNLLQFLSRCTCGAVGCRVRENLKLLLGCFNRAELCACCLSAAWFPCKLSSSKPTGLIGHPSSSFKMMRLACWINTKKSIRSHIVLFPITRGQSSLILHVPQVSTTYMSRYCPRINQKIQTKFIFKMLVT